MSEADKEIDAKIKEWQEKRRKEKGKTEIEVTVDTSSMETLVGRIKNLEPQAKAFQDLAKNLARKCQAIGVDIDSSDIKDVEDFKTIVQEYYEAKEKNEGIPINLEKKGSSGQIPLSQQSGSGSRSFDSIDEMIDDLRNRASSKTQEGEEAQAILDELFKKSLRGQIETKSAFKETEYKGKRKPSGKEKGLVETLNEGFRKRRKKRMQDEKE